MRPLDFLGRIKVKLGLIIVLAVATAFAVYEFAAPLPREWRIVVAVALALVMVQVLAQGMTKPLREMAKAAQTVAKGRYDLRVSATSRDEVGELARAFNAMAADLGEVDRQRRELVANVSHELRTPITGLRAVLENVVDGVSPPDTLRTALAQTERLGRLVAQLLDLSRLDSGTRLVEAETVELAPLVEQVVRESAAARDDVRIETDVPREAAVRADPDLLAQVLANLLDNAVRHSPERGIVTVSVSGSTITVADRGPGIPESARARVFERFSRLDAARAADAGGAGLGLAIVREIVELHGGSIHIGDGAGCRMIVDLPGRLTMAETPLETVAGEPAAESVGVRGSEVVAKAEPAVVAAAVEEPEAVVAATAGPVVAEPEREAVSAGAPVAVANSAPVHVPVLAPGGAAPYVAPLIMPGMGKLVAGCVIGVSGGFFAGLVAAVFASVGLGGGAAMLVLIVFILAGGFFGTWAGAASRRRSIEEALARQQADARRAAAMSVHPIDTKQVAVNQPPPPQAQAHGSQPQAAQPYGPQAQAAQPYGPHAGQGQAFGPPPPPPLYVPPPLFPRPDLPETPRWLLPAAAGAGVFAAVAIPDSAPGLGLVLVALVVAAAALPAVARRVTPWTLAFGAIAVGLISVAAWRDADWLVALCVMGGFGLGALAVSGAGAGWLGVIRGGASVLLSMIPVPWFLAAPLKQLTARRRIMPIVGALGITAFLLLIFGGLFSSADAVFAGYVEQLLTTPAWAESIPGRLFVFVVVGAGLAALVLVALRPVVDPVSPSFRTQVNSALWVVPLSALNVLFALFVALQITVLFGGDERVLRTSGLTYAEYARQGFFQLVFVSVIVVAIVAVTSAVVRTGNRSRWLLAGELGTLCALTMVILFSAWHRMDLYVEAYGWTRLRISVQAAIYGLAILFVLILIAGAVRLAGRGSGWLPRTVVLVAGLGLFAFALVNPDYQVAVSQVDRQRMDASYLRDLGAEAAPALDRAPEPQRSCLLRSVGASDGPNDWRSWNLARSRAMELIAAKGLVEGPCR